PSFAAQQSILSGTDPQSAVAADVNGDGRPDLIVANEGNDDVLVLLNTTAPGATPPSFAAPRLFATGREPIPAAVADANGDGRPDLLVANALSTNVSVLPNTTAPGAPLPSFAAQQSFGTGSEPFSVAAADVNGDGRPDLLAANYNSNTVTVRL